MDTEGISRTMSDDLKEASNGGVKGLTLEEKQQKIGEVRRVVDSFAGEISSFCTDASISRYLRAQNWSVKRACKMMKETLKWRLQYKPDEISWEDISHEAQTGKIYITNYVDKHGRTVLVMRPSCQNSKSTKGQIKYLVYCMEKAIINLPFEQEQMVWLIDFQGFNISDISVKVTKETAHVLQDHYPERLGLAILYNPPKFFEPFWKVVKPFLESKTCSKVKFVYPNDHHSNQVLEELFDMDKLESGFGGKAGVGFEINKYAERMKEEDKRMGLVSCSENRDSAAMFTDSVSDSDGSFGFGSAAVVGDEIPQIKNGEAGGEDGICS